MPHVPLASAPLRAPARDRGYVLLDGYHADHTSLGVLQRVETGEGACTLRLVNVGNNATVAASRFKVEYILV